MKTYSLIFLLAVCAVAGGCSSAYRSGQTPDAVYYSPAVENGGPASSDQQVAAVQDNNPDAGQYITYDDGNNGSYAYNAYDNYYTQRISMFDRPGSLYALNSYYGMGGPGYYGSPYLGYYGGPYLGLGDPFMWSYPFLSVGLNFGSPWGGWYSPLYRYGIYSPYYAGYMHGYTTGYYGGGYGYGYGGGYYGKVSPRPAVSYGPRRTVSSRAATAVSGSRTTTGTTANSPRRVFRAAGNTNTNGTGTTTISRPRRVFRSNPGEHPVNVSTNTRVVEKQSGVRIFRRSNVTDRSSNSNNRRVETYRPSRETRTVQPRTFERNTRSVPSFNSSSESHSAPARTFSPRGRR